VPGFDRSELAALLRQHQAGLSTSRAEGWGLALQEMLEAGLTVYATPEGAVRDIQPFVPGQLLPFPPASSTCAAPCGAMPASYYEQFSWRAIARDYERILLESPATEGLG
jgi:glycosyltransferase involved in cell wall biosynthesis